MAESIKLDTAKLKNFENAAAGHDGVLSDESGELIIKPCTQAEIDFYQESLTNHPKFYELMPTFMGTLSLGAPTQASDPTATHDPAELAQNALHGTKLKTETSIVLENLEYGFKRANVLDIKLGAKLYADGTNPEKAARLDKVASETTSGSLHFRIAGMKVWNGSSFDLYDKMYGRKFDAANVKDGFATFFSGLSPVSLPGSRSNDDGTTAAATAAPDQQLLLLETILADLTRARHSLERSESRMYSASVLIVYEGDAEARDAVLRGHELTTTLPRGGGPDERAPTRSEISESEAEDAEEEEAAEGGERPVAYRVRMIDFAHAAWTPGEGRDENVIVGLRNVEEQMDLLIARFQ